MIKRKFKRKIFKDNESYFEFYNKNKEKINVIEVDTQKYKTILKYEDKEVE